MNLACSGIAPKGKVEDWVKLVGKVERVEDKVRMENGMKVLYDHFQLAPELGSLLDPTNIKADAFTASFEELQPILKRALENEVDTEQLERGVMAAGIAKAGQLLGKKYTLQITNVPYLGKGKMNEILTNFSEKYFPDAKADLATIFLKKMLNSLKYGGTACSVIPQNWLFLTTYKKFRENLLKKHSWSIVARLGAKAFQTPMWDFNVMLISINNQTPSLDYKFSGLDVSTEINAFSKEAGLITADIVKVNQNKQLKNPDQVIIIEVENDNKSEQLLKYAKYYSGLQTGDGNKLLFNFWEINNSSFDLIQRADGVEELYNGLSYITPYQEGKGLLAKEPGAVLRNIKLDVKRGIVVHRMGQLKANLFVKSLVHENGVLICPFKDEHLPIIWTFITSKQFIQSIRSLNQKVSVTPNFFTQVDFDFNYWKKIAEEKYPNGLPKPYSDDPTQWLFHGHPIKTENPLQVALARVLGYRWPAEEVNNTSAKVEAASSGFQKETDSGDIKNNAAGSSIYYTLAEEAKELIEAVKAFDHLTDEDGIFCIPSVNAEQAGAERLRDYLQQVFAGEWNNQTITQLLRKVEAASSSLDDYLRNEFFAQHCKLFQNRPFIWHIWDGRKDGFSALVNYHKLDKDNLSKLIYTYLNDWIRVCVAKKNAGESGAEGLLSAAQKLKENLEAILHGEAPYDIFVRWKPLEQQPIGWEPDLNDGVRLNIRPFVEAGVLRNKFNVKWGVDRGKNPPGSFWGEVRDNDKHLSLAEKREAREKIKS
jgi:hypothetical protein